MTTPVAERLKLIAHRIHTVADIANTEKELEALINTPSPTEFALREALADVIAVIRINMPFYYENDTRVHNALAALALPKPPTQEM